MLPLPSPPDISSVLHHPTEPPHQPPHSTTSPAGPALPTPPHRSSVARRPVEPQHKPHHSTPIPMPNEKILISHLERTGDRRRRKAATRTLGLITPGGRYGVTGQPLLNRHDVGGSPPFQTAVPKPNHPHIPAALQPQRSHAHSLPCGIPSQPLSQSGRSLGSYYRCTRASCPPHRPPPPPCSNLQPAQLPAGHPRQATLMQSASPNPFPTTLAHNHRSSPSQDHILPRAE